MRAGDRTCTRTCTPNNEWMTPTTSLHKREDNRIGQPISRQAAGHYPLDCNESGRPDMHPETIHSKPRETRLFRRNLWRRKFVQYIKLTKYIILSIMTKSKEVLSQFRDQQKLEIKDTIPWAIGQSALTEMTKTFREQEPSALPLNKKYTLFRFAFYPRKKCTTQPGRFF